MTELLLIDSHRHEIAAEYTQSTLGGKVVVHNQTLLEIINTCGIAVSRKEFGTNKSYIFTTDEANLFARAFTEEFVAHRQGYYWVKKEDYTGPEGEFQKALKYVLGAFNRN
jgi:hypothetical protein